MSILILILSMIFRHLVLNKHLLFLNIPKGLTIIDPLPINYILFENNEYSGDLWVEKNRPTYSHLDMAGGPKVGLVLVPL